MRRGVIQLMLWLPVAIGLLCFVVPRRAVPALASIGSLVVLGRAIVMVAEFHAGRPGLQQTVERELDPRPRRALPARRRRHQPVPGPADGGPVGGATVSPPSALADRPRIYFFMLGLAETAALGAFLAQDLLLFVLFFDLMLVPFFFLIGTFGGENRVAATTKMIVYTLVGSLLMLVAAIATAILASGQIGHISFSIAELRAHVLSDRQPVLDLLLLRRGVPGQDAGLPGPRLDARRLPGRAAAGAGAALGRALEGRRLRLPARRAAALSRRRPSTSRS